MDNFGYKYEKKIPQKFYCEKCDYGTSKKFLYTQHLSTLKHKFHIMDNENMKNMKKNMLFSFRCELCDYSTSNKFLFKQHLSTLKHENMKNMKKNMLKKDNMVLKIEDESSKFICSCGKKYKYNTGLLKHKKKCKNIDDQVKELKNMFSDLLKKTDENVEIQNELMDVITSQNNIIVNNIKNLNQTTFNLNFFLNEECKNALNIDEFIAQLQIGLDELEYTKNNGINKGILNIFINGLKEVGTYKQPIHCTDSKRETIYIKNNNIWDKEDSIKKLEKSIQNIQNIQIQKLKTWQNENIGWENSQEKKDEYLELVSNVMDNIDNNKTTKEITKEVLIKKI